MVASRIIKEKEEVREEGFKLLSPEKYDLSIEFGTGHVSYAVFDPVSRFLKMAGKLQFEFSEKKDSYALLFSELQSAAEVIRQGFHSVYLTWNRAGATLVPASFYSEQNKEELLRFNLPVNENSRVIAEDVRGADIKVIYAMPEPMKLFFDAHLSNHKLKHIATSLIETVLASSSKNEKKALLNINSADFNLLLMNNGSLRFFNTFSYLNSEDILYYTLFAMEQNGFDPHNDKLLISGEIEAGSGTHQLLSQYVKNISFAITDKSVVRGEKLSVLPHHFYFNTINRFVCG